MDATLSVCPAAQGVDTTTFAKIAFREYGAQEPYVIKAAFDRVRKTVRVPLRFSHIDEAFAWAAKNAERPKPPPERTLPNKSDLAFDEARLIVAWIDGNTAVSARALPQFFLDRGLKGTLGPTELAPYVRGCSDAGVNKAASWIAWACELPKSASRGNEVIGPVQNIVGMLIKNDPAEIRRMSDIYMRATGKEWPDASSQTQKEEGRA